MNCLQAKSIVLFLLLGSLSVTPCLSPEEDPGVGPGVVSNGPAAALAAQAGGQKRLDFNGDGYEDILWRYYGEGGYNRVWFLGISELGAPPLSTAAPLMTTRAAGKYLSENRTSKRILPDPRTMGVVGKHKNGSRPKDPQVLMGGPGRRNAGSASVDDPRQAGGGGYQAVWMSVADPRQVPGGGEMAAAPVLLDGADVLPVADLNWQIVGTGDFDNDTYVDILWRNASTGSNVVWFMNGADWNSSAELLPVPDLSWQIVGTGDFNLDTHVDILWRNGVSGANVVWYMNGTEWDSSDDVLGVSDFTWQIVGTGDFNNDTHVDILWRNISSGSNVIWYMNNAGWIGSVELISVADLNWQIAGTGDFNDDANIDILWRYNGVGGSNVIWYLSGAGLIGSTELLPVPDLSWKNAIHLEEAIVGEWTVSYTFPGDEDPADRWKFLADGRTSIWDGEEWDDWRGTFAVSGNIMMTTVDLREDTCTVVATIIDVKTMQGTIHDNYTGATVAWSASRDSQLTARTSKVVLR